MIKRHYFIYAEKPHRDGKGSYSCNSMTATYRSWLPNPLLVYREAKTLSENEMIGEKGDSVHIISFNRI
jgi:hypothetical protein